MCVICVKPKGKPFPSEVTQQQMFERNSDGAGFMFVRNGKVQIRKGFMNFKSFRKALEREELTEDIAVVMHFRIGTSGSKSPQNCHPFPITSNIKALRKQQLSCEVGVAHNGILSYQANEKLDFSDTMSFIYDVLSDESVYSQLRNSSMIALIDMAIGNSKFALLFDNEDIELIGDFVKHDHGDDGCLYSNVYFTPAKTCNVTAITPTRYYESEGWRKYGRTGQYFDRALGKWRNDPDDEQSWDDPIYDQQKMAWRNRTKTEIQAGVTKDMTVAERTSKLMEAEFNRSSTVVDDVKEMVAGATHCPHCGAHIGDDKDLWWCNKCGGMFYRADEWDRRMAY